MNRISIIARHEYLVNVRRPGFIFFTLLIPAIGLIALVIGAFFSGQAQSLIASQLPARNRIIGVVDETGLLEAPQPELADRFQVYPSADLANRAFVSNQISSYVVIPPDYVTAGSVTIYARAGLEAADSIDPTGLRSFIVQGLLSGKLDSTLVARASRPDTLKVVALDSNGQPAEDAATSMAGLLIPYFLSIFLMISIFTSSGYLLRSVGEEKETRVIEIILSSVTAPELLAGKVIGLGGIGLTQVVVWLASALVLSKGAGAVVAGAVLNLNLVTLLLTGVYFVLGFLVFGTIMATAGALGTNMREGQQIASLFLLLAALPYMISGFLFANPDSLFARVLSFFPLTAPTTMMFRLQQENLPLGDIVVSILILLVSVPVGLWAGAKVFRMGLLIYGKRSSLREIIRALAAA